MRLLYIHQYFCFPDSNGGTRSYDLGAQFVKNGIDVTFITSSKSFQSLVSDGRKWSYIERDGLKVWILKCDYSNRMGFLRRIWSFVYFLIFATIKSLQIRCDLILVTSTPLTIAVPALINKWFRRIPFVFEARDVWPEVPIKMGYVKNKILQKLLYRFEYMVYNNSSWVVPLSIGMKDNITKRYLKKKNYTVIPNISEISRFQNGLAGSLLGDEYRGRKIVLYCGTIGIVNGLKYLVDLASYTLPKDADIIYLIYGGGNELEIVTDYAYSKDVINKNVFFKGVVSKNQLPALYAECVMGSSFVINNPVLWDNSANKFFDTLAAGKPMLINHEGWQSDVIKEYDCGYVLSAELNDAGASDFVNYINDSLLLSKQGQNALNLAKARYSLDVATNEYINIFKYILSDV